MGLALMNGFEPSSLPKYTKKWDRLSEDGPTRYELFHKILKEFESSDNTCLKKTYQPDSTISRLPAKECVRDRNELGLMALIMGSKVIVRSTGNTIYLFKKDTYNTLKNKEGN